MLPVSKCYSSRMCLSQCKRTPWIKQFVSKSVLSIRECDKVNKCRFYKDIWYNRPKSVVRGEREYTTLFVVNIQHWIPVEINMQWNIVCRSKKKKVILRHISLSFYQFLLQLNSIQRYAVVPNHSNKHLNQTLQNYINNYIELCRKLNKSTLIKHQATGLTPRL